MKAILILASFICLATTTSNPDFNKSKIISGKVTNADKEPIFGANVFIYGTKKGTMTDSLGEFSLIIPEDIEKITVSHRYHKKKDFVITDLNDIVIQLEKGRNNADYPEEREEAISLEGHPRMSKSKAPMSKRTREMKSPAPAATKMLYDVGHSEASPVVEGAVDYSGVPDRDDAYSDKADHSRAGQLTAGEWNDLANWKAWNELVDEKDYKEMGQHWGINSSDRVSVFVSNSYELPIPDCTVTLTSNGKIIWTSKTDNAGKAELWVSNGLDALEINVRSKSNQITISSVKRFKDGINRVQFKEECNATKKAEIMFVVDATGSMGDEIEFLKTELQDVIDAVESSRSEVAFRWGSVFYRDDADTYLTRQLPLTGKTKKVLDFIKMQSAGGGGDYPEAVNEGLEEALIQDWSEDAIARIVFLVLDAPPHHDPEVLKDLQSQIAFASAMGIKLIPIIASGINRQTEYLMKFMSIMTNGTYVFLTDHSGIGNSHLKPVVDDFEVEKLNDLLVRVIGNYTDPGRCNSQVENDPIFVGIEVFPNPTIDLLQVKVPAGIRKITLTTSSGMVIQNETIKDQCDLSFDLRSYVDGMYMVNFYSDDQVYSYKVIKSNKA